jgi:hypothetical protein
MNPLTHYSLADLKRIYTTLHAALSRDSLLMDSNLLADLQTHLISEARRVGVDVSDHASWTMWLSDQGDER